VAGPSVTFIGACPVRGVLISGALVIQLVVVAGSVGTAVVMPLAGEVTEWEDGCSGLGLVGHTVGS
jgi:hypothetical protein